MRKKYFIHLLYKLNNKDIFTKIPLKNKKKALRRYYHIMSNEIEKVTNLSLYVKTKKEVDTIAFYEVVTVVENK